MNQDPAELTFVDFKCPYCGGPVSFPDTCLGTVQECPACFQTLIAPENGSDEGEKLPLPLQTPRLRLRRLTPGDSVDFTDLMGDEESFRYIDWRPLEEAEVEDWLAKDRETRLTEPGAELCLAVELLEAEKLIGIVSLHYLDQQRRQMGFTTMIHRGYRRQGFGTAAARGAAGFALPGLRNHRLSVSCDTRNTAAFRMLERAGFRREGEFIQDAFQKGEWVSRFWYALLREEYVPTAEPN